MTSMRSMSLFWRTAQFMICAVWVLVLTSLFWPEPSTFRLLCWVTLIVMVVAHGVEGIWFVWHHRRNQVTTPGARHLIGVFAFGLFYFVPYFKGVAAAEKAQEKNAGTS